MTPLALIVGDARHSLALVRAALEHRSASNDSNANGHAGATLDAATAAAAVAMPVSDTDVDAMLDAARALALPSPFEQVDRALDRDDGQPMPDHAALVAALKERWSA